MKLEKKHWIVVGVIVAIILIWYFFLRKKKAESGYAIRGVRESPTRSGSGYSALKNKPKPLPPITPQTTFDYDLLGGRSTGSGLTVVNKQFSGESKCQPGFHWVEPGLSRSGGCLPDAELLGDK